VDVRIDPFAVEILKDKLAATADEMGVVLARTSMSPIVYEVLDFACGLTDAQARVVAQTNGLTLFTGTFGPQVESVIADYGLDGMRPGDVFATNVPYRGGTHTCDVCLVKPIFAAGRVVAFAVSITHWIDIGGSVPGSIPPDATDIYQEGLRLPGVRVYDAGQLLIEVTPTTTKTIARFKARKPEPPRQRFQAGAVTDHLARIRNACGVSLLAGD